MTLSLFAAGLVLVCQIGTASQYAPGVMEAVLATRQRGLTAHTLPTPLPPVDGYAASLDCDAIGQVWTVRYGTHLDRLLVADCAGHASTRTWMQRGNILLEVDYRTAARWDVVGRGARPVQVCVKQGGSYGSVAGPQWTGDRDEDRLLHRVSR